LWYRMAALAELMTVAQGVTTVVTQGSVATVRNQPSVQPLLSNRTSCMAHQNGALSSRVDTWDLWAPPSSLLRPRPRRITCNRSNAFRPRGREEYCKVMCYALITSGSIKLLLYSRCVAVCAACNASLRRPRVSIATSVQKEEANKVLFSCKIF
jgi:hypothetical protein